MATDWLGEPTIRCHAAAAVDMGRLPEPPHDIDVHTLTEPQELSALRPAWDALWRRADGDYVQAPATCLAAWRLIADRGGVRLHVVVGYEGDILVAVWPLVRRRQAVWRVLYQLGPQAAEFSEMLLEGGPRKEARAAAIWRWVRVGGSADMVVLPFVKTDGPLGILLAAGDLPVTVRPDVAPHVAWRPGETWDQYYATLGASWRKVQNKKRRQLEQLGDLRFEVVRDPQRLPGLIAWLMREKRVWAARADKRGPWLSSDEFESFLKQLGTGQAVGTGFMFLLTLDGEPVAAQLAIEGERHIDWIIAGFSAAMAGRSPGMVLNEHCLRYALDAGLQVEMGAGCDANKLLWSRGAAHATLDHRIALTRFGQSGLALSNAKIAAAGWLARRRARRSPKPETPTP